MLHNTYCTARCANAPTCEVSIDRHGDEPADYAVQWVETRDLGAECAWFKPEPEAA